MLQTANINFTISCSLQNLSIRDTSVLFPSESSWQELYCRWGETNIIVIVC